MIDFAQFAELDAQVVAELVADTLPEPLGVGIPFNGTRRWYMASFGARADALYTQDYLDQVFGKMREIIRMMFADGVQAIYTPIMGYDLAARGDEYMQFGLSAIAQVARPEVIDWYRAHHIDAACYGELAHLPEQVREVVTTMHALTCQDDTSRYLRFGVFADRATDPIIRLACGLRETLGVPPSASQLVQAYYQGPVGRLGMWVGSDQPTVFDVPLVMHGNTALYFLHYPTLYLDHRAWRRLLYDVLFVRGDQETLYPDNIVTVQHISGLGIRREDGWSPSPW